MGYQKELKKEMENTEQTWELFQPYKGFQHMYHKFMRKTRLVCKVFKKFHMNKEKKSDEEMPKETMKIVIEKDHIETINTIRKEPKQVNSLKIKCKIQIQNQAL